MKFEAPIMFEMQVVGTAIEQEEEDTVSHAMSSFTLPLGRMVTAEEIQKMINEAEERFKKEGMRLATPGELASLALQQKTSIYQQWGGIDSEYSPLGSIGNNSDEEDEENGE